IKKDRRQLATIYGEQLKEFQQLKIRGGTEWNYSYFPIVFETEALLLKAQKKLMENDIFPRRYFYPNLTQLPYIKGAETPISSSIASRILCLPLYFGMGENVILQISKITKTALQ